MVLSMTGFGSSKFEDENYRILIEVRSLNSKFLDLQLRTPRILASKEMEIRDLISKSLNRGKVNVNIDVEPKKLDESTINKPLLISYYNELKELALQVGDSGQDLLKLAIQQTEQMSSGQIVEAPDSLLDQVLTQLKIALDACTAYRSNEGKNLKRELSKYNASILSLKNEIEELAKARAEKIKIKLEKGLNDLAESEEMDRNRLEQEIIYYLEKLDITEELVRLDSHSEYFDNILEEKNCGKKLGFLSQELGREINTIGSKANDAPIQRLVVLMKEELEKIKEQSLNVL